MESNKHDHASDTVAGASKALAEQVAENGTSNQTRTDAFKDTVKHQPRNMLLITEQPRAGKEGALESPVNVLGGLDGPQRRPEADLAMVSNLTQAAENLELDTTTTNSGHDSGQAEPGSRTPPAKLDFKLALQWRREKRTGKPLTKLPAESFFTELTGRDHVSFAYLA